MLVCTEKNFGAKRRKERLVATAECQGPSLCMYAQILHHAVKQAHHTHIHTDTETDTQTQTRSHTPGGSAAGARRAPAHIASGAKQRTVQLA